tara:strand:- start:82 stop:225 length:144 start_codon:yes stop_codon:yes gene_type:complete
MVKIESVIEKTTSEDQSKISASQFEKIKSLEGEWYLAIKKGWFPRVE